MSTDETYNGWTNRETWAVALHINNDQGWQESVHESLREQLSDYLADPADASDREGRRTAAIEAGEIIRENVEEVLDMPQGGMGDDAEWARHYREHILPVREDIGSLWRVNWTELGEAFLSDLEGEG